MRLLVCVTLTLPQHMVYKKVVYWFLIEVSTMIPGLSIETSVSAQHHRQARTVSFVSDLRPSLCSFREKHSVALLRSAAPQMEPRIFNVMFIFEFLDSWQVCS